MPWQFRVGEELGIANCDFVAQGESEGEVVEQVVQHLRQDHNVAMPDAEVILQQNAHFFQDEAVQAVVRRLRDHLNLGTAEGRPYTTDTPPPGIDSGSPLNRG